MKLQLPNVTLCAMGSIDINGMIKALEYSCKGIEFGAVKLVSDKSDYPVPDCITHVSSCGLISSIDEWSRAIVFDLGEYIDTEYAILIHPDGFIVNPDAWSEVFLDYDYVGAPWPLPTDDYSYKDINGVVQRVGNSVSLRSKKLLDLPKKLNMEWKSFYGNMNEDGYVCVNMRHVFEEHGCQFAPLYIAKYFSREVSLPENKDLVPFAFHKHAGPNAQYPNFEGTA